jgi:hypothetical protein
LIATLKATGAELGLAFDGDGDRLGIVTQDGETIYPDRQMQMFAEDVLSRVPGGTILFDTRDMSIGTPNAGQEILRRVTRGLDIPRLEKVPADHVLTKSFYILKDFPGRWTGAPIWVEALPPAERNAARTPARGGDGVSPVIIGGNDFAAAWAVDAQGRFLSELTPGGDTQRELAFRFGVNVVMYALTGNYKTDQVHAPALLQRLGRER